MKLATGWKTELMLLTLVLLLVQSACAGPDPAAQAWQACIMFVQNRTGMPVDDAQPHNPAGVAQLAPDRYLVKVYYPKANGFYRCEILHRPDDNWQLLSLDFLR